MTAHLACETPFSIVRVLIVDDNEAITKTFGWMLEMLGHEARVAQDGPTAIALARTFLPNVVILDVSMPGMDGYEVCEKMRAEPEMANCIFISQTGWTQPEHLERSRKAGFDHHWVKPTPIERLEGLLNTLVNKTAA